MLPRRKRLSVSLFTDVVTNGKIAHSPLFTARILKTAASDKTETRFSVAISKKIAKTAVERNTVRRRIYSVVAKIQPQLVQNLLVVLLAKQPTLKARPQDIASDLESLFGKNGLIK